MVWRKLGFTGLDTTRSDSVRLLAETRAFVFLFWASIGRTRVAHGQPEIGFRRFSSYRPLEGFHFRYSPVQPRGLKSPESSSVAWSD